MDEFLDFFKQKKNLINVLLLGIVILALPLVITTLKQQKIIQSRAATDPVVFTGSNLIDLPGNKKGFTLNAEGKAVIGLELTSPLGPPAQSSTQTVQLQNTKKGIVAGISQSLIKSAYAANCSVSWQISNNNPVPNQDIDVQVKQEAGGSSGVNWLNVHLYLDNSQAGLTFVNFNDSTRTSTYKVNSGSPGLHTLKFTTDNNAVTCTPTQTFTTSGGTSSGGCPTDSNLTISPNPAKVGDIITFQYQAGEDVWLGDDTWSGGVSPNPCPREGQAIDRKFSCTAQSAVTNATWKHYWNTNNTPPSCGSASYTINAPVAPVNGSCKANHYECNTGTSGSQQELADRWTWKCNGSNGGSSADCVEMKSLTCAVSGPASVERGSKATYSVTSNDARIRTIELYYNYKDKSLGSDYHKFATCNTNETQLSGNCKGELDTSVIPADRVNLTVNCNAYDWRPREDGVGGCNQGNNDPLHCTPSGVDLKVNACTGNPLWTPERDFGWSGCGSSSHQEVTIAAPAGITTDFRIAENPTDLATADWQQYTDETRIIDNFEFKDKTPGEKFVFVQFKGADDKGKPITTTTANCPKCKAEIRLLNPNPLITSCTLSFEENNTTLNLKGTNFGSVKGSVKSNDANLSGSVKKWKDDNVTIIWQAAPAGEVLPVILTNSDGQVSEEAQCGATSQLAVGAKVFCRTPSNHNTDNIDLTLAGAFDGGTKARQKVKLDKDGIIQGLNLKLEEGKKYKISVKAPRSIRKNAEFTAEAGGITNIPIFILPVGDIYPLDGGDGIINGFDKGELNREFILTQDSCGRAGDFNQDCRVNSIDWSCMRHDFGKQDDNEVNPGADPTPRPASSSSSTSVPSASSTPLPSSSSALCLPTNSGCVAGSSSVCCSGLVCRQSSTNGEGLTCQTPQTCISRPACLDLPNPCTIMEPADGWCPVPTPTPELVSCAPGAFEEGCVVGACCDKVPRVGKYEKRTCKADGTGWDVVSSCSSSCTCEVPPNQ